MSGSGPSMAIDNIQMNIDPVTNLPTMSSDSVLPTTSNTSTSTNLNGEPIQNYMDIGGDNYVLLVMLIGITIIYLVFFLSMSSQTSYEGSSSMSLLEGILILIFVILAIMNVLKYFFNIDVSATLKNVFSSEPELDIVINKLEDVLDPSKKDDGGGNDNGNANGTSGGLWSGGKQVFHIDDNLYTYEDAKGICGAFGARLANYYEVEEAYKKGGEWCSYGWSDDQMVLFPTQKNTYEKMKKKGTPNNCGRPGVNGGYIGNPMARFGVNCYGKKPKITPAEQQRMDDYKELSSMDTSVDPEIQEYWRTQLNTMNVAPFNETRWSM